MKNLLLLIALTCCIGCNDSFAYPALSEQDRRSIASTSLTEGQKRLAEHFVEYIREEGKRLGINPALAFPQSPTGLDDREYRRGRLEELREKREAQKFQIERLQSRSSLKESLPRSEALLLIAQQIGVSPEKTQMLLARYEPRPTKIVSVSEEDNGQYLDFNEVYGDKPPPLNPKEAAKIRRAQEAEQRKIDKQTKQEDIKQQKAEAKRLADEEKAKEKARKEQEKAKKAKEKADAKEAKKQAKANNLPFYGKQASGESTPPETTTPVEQVDPKDVSLKTIFTTKKELPPLHPKGYVYELKILSEEGK